MVAPRYIKRHMPSPSLLYLGQSIDFWHTEVAFQYLRNELPVDHSPPPTNDS